MPPDPATWTPEQIRAWIDRHGGNVTAAARRLRVPRSKLTSWLADPEEASSARPLPPYIEAHMETLDDLAEIDALVVGRGFDGAAD